MIDSFIKFEKGNIKVDSYRFYGGIFDLPVENTLFPEVVKSFDDTDSVETIAKKLNTSRGRRIQKAVFKKKYIKPVKRYCKRRGLVNKSIMHMLIVQNTNNNFSLIASVLDATRDYSFINIVHTIKDMS